MDYLCGIMDGAIAVDRLVRETMTRTSSREEFSEAYERELAYLSERIRERRAGEVLAYLEEES